MVWEPDFAVRSPKLAAPCRFERARWIAALDADAARYEMFLATFASPAMGTKYWGKAGSAASSTNAAASKATEDRKRHHLGLASNAPDQIEAKATPPSMPNPSFTAQFAAAAKGAADASPTPTAVNSTRVDKTPPADEQAKPANCNNALWICRRQRQNWKRNALNWPPAPMSFHRPKMRLSSRTEPNQNFWRRLVMSFGHP